MVHKVIRSFSLEQLTIERIKTYADCLGLSASEFIDRLFKTDVLGSKTLAEKVRKIRSLQREVIEELAL